MTITLSPAAAKEVLRIMRQQGFTMNEAGLFLSYNPRASGQRRYDLQVRQFEKAAPPDVEQCESEGVAIRWNRQSHAFFHQASIDFKELDGQWAFAVMQPAPRWPLAEPFAASWLKECLEQVIDPEVGLNIVDLGLVYETKVDGNHVQVVMTMTTPACPLTEMIVADVESAIRIAQPDVADVQIELVWHPPWTRAMISQRGRRLMGWK